MSASTVTEYIPSMHYILGLIPRSTKRRKKGGMKTKELRDRERGKKEAN